jgi:hypothetical protein
MRRRPEADRENVEFHELDAGIFSAVLYDEIRNDISADIAEAGRPLDVSHPVKVAARRVKQGVNGLAAHKSGSSVRIDTVRFSSAPQPLRLSLLFHQFFLKILVKTCFALSVPRLSTVIRSLMAERSRRGALFRIDA